MIQCAILIITPAFLFVFLGSLCQKIIKLLIKHDKKAPKNVLFIECSTVFQISRIILTSHYLSDVIAGAGIGILLTMAVKYFFDRKKINLTVK